MHRDRKLNKETVIKQDTHKVVLVIYDSWVVSREGIQLPTLFLINFEGMRIWVAKATWLGEHQVY